MAKKALIVDNDFFFLEFFSEILERRGYEVLKARDGKEGISVLDESSVDFVFTDIVMPKIDGIEFIKYIRKTFPDARFPIVAVAGNLVEQLDEIKNVGADYYIAKGTAATMEEYINRFMDKIEAQPFPESAEEELIEPGKLFPRQATAELIDNVHWERAITESLGMGVLVLDKDAKILRANSMALETLDVSYEDIVNNPVTGLFPAEEKQALVDALKRVVREPELKKLDLALSYGSGSIRVILTRYLIDNETKGWIACIEEA